VVRDSLAAVDWSTAILNATPEGCVSRSHLDLLPTLYGAVP